MRLIPRSFRMFLGRLAGPLFERIGLIQEPRFVVFSVDAPVVPQYSLKEFAKILDQTDTMQMVRHVVMIGAITRLPKWLARIRWVTTWKPHSVSNHADGRTVINGIFSNPNQPTSLVGLEVEGDSLFERLKECQSTVVVTISFTPPNYYRMSSVRWTSDHSAQIEIPAKSVMLSFLNRQDALLFKMLS